ncbi:MAG: hypothetical protein UW75_C0010G0001 [Parcubacteria group bacterium GW2011_GWF2_44_8]|nr:MAG: hypothetical protein UW75_C0010G0001 [Parcubacteria group bacterium GW2011_GWF2_44_8]
MIQLVAGEEVDGFGNLFLSLLFGEGLAAVDVRQNILLTGSLKRSPGSFDLNNKFTAVFGLVCFNELAQCTNLPLSSIKAIGDVFSGVCFHTKRIA